MFQYKLINEFLSEYQCQSVLDYSLNNIELQTAKIIGENEVIVDSHRKSKIGFNKYDNFDFLYNKITNLINENLSVNGYEIKWNNKGYQFTSYGKRDYYNWHTDEGHERYCSVVILLNDNYDGGLLELMVENKIVKIEPKRGNAVIFLSNLNHRVTEVLEGTRYSLVNWLTLTPIEGRKKSII